MIESAEHSMIGRADQLKGIAIGRRYRALFRVDELKKLILSRFSDDKNLKTYLNLAFGRYEESEDEFFQLFSFHDLSCVDSRAAGSNAQL